MGICPKLIEAEEDSMSKIFVRERRNIGKGVGRPRFEIVAVTGLDLKVYHSHIRKAELEKIAADVSAELVYLPRGEHAGEEDEGESGRRGQRRGRGRHSDQD
jgi:hypothetical protein